MPPTWSNKLPVLQILLHRDQVNRLPRVEHRRQRLVNGLMPQIVKRRIAVVLEFLDALADALIRVQQRAAQHAHFHLNIMRRQPVNALRRTTIGRPQRLLAAGFFQIGRSPGTGAPCKGSETESIIL